MSAAMTAMLMTWAAELASPAEPASDVTWRLIMAAAARAGDADDDAARARVYAASSLYHSGAGHIACLAPLRDSDIW